ncbi:prepilin peptidase [Neobacillus niacini]|uniref:A24 family peptidase n=1 Tax=Neobacillus niacini TaxID=86668 RepID=UPI002FFDF5CF
MMIKTVLIVALLISLITDIKNRKILNIVTTPSVLFALFYYTTTLGLEGFVFSIKGFGVGLGLLLIPYMLGGMGAGDVKLMAAIGALMGTSFVFYCFLYTALIGGLIALMIILKQKGLVITIKTFFYKIVFFQSNVGSIVLKKENQTGISFPYGVAIVLGTLFTLVWGGF